MCLCISDNEIPIHSCILSLVTNPNSTVWQHTVFLFKQTFWAESFGTKTQHCRLGLDPTNRHPELSWILFHKKSLLTTLRYRSSDFLFLRVCAIASHYTKSACFRVYINRYFATLSMTIDILRHSEPTKWVKNLFRQYLVNSANKQIPKRVRNDKQNAVTLNCLGFCFTKKILRYAVLDFLAVDFLDFTFRLRLRSSVENLLLTSSLALLDSTLPKSAQYDAKYSPSF